ncbi:MAG: 2-amino-4-hydroxy-6-hydroxymethyldihydropteridine diphosphokinase [Gammaproteobacteria bacterium]|nr:2-amino-4-hydroxy-6-hydroxymethyldihydropteridine diphosphokinase [Gammaproteobacteria bacterium]
MSTVYISIGSNLEREKNVAQSIRLLNEHFDHLHCSTIYETVPVGFEGGLFYNLVVRFETELSPEDVVNALKSIETTCGRIHNQKKFSNRSLDLDLLLYDDLVINQGKVNIPRQEILDYAFVLEPLAEIAPDLIHPQIGKSYAELWQAFDQSDQAQRPLTGLLERMLFDQ